MIGRSGNAIGNHARDRARPPSTAVRHVGQAAQADIHLEGFINVERRWRKIRKDTGLDWVTPHTFRKTVATLISERVNAETASQQLGHSSPAITREFYISKPAIAADVAHVLDELAGPGPGDGLNTWGISGE